MELTQEQLEEYERIATMKERERCARIVEKIPSRSSELVAAFKEHAAASIRNLVADEPEVRRLQREIAERQTRLAHLVLGDQSKGVG